MKTAQELRLGNVFMVGKDPMVVVKSEYSKGGRGASTVKMKMKNLLTNAMTEPFSVLTTSLKTSSSNARK